MDLVQASFDHEGSNGDELRQVQCSVAGSMNKILCSDRDGIAYKRSKAGVRSSCHGVTYEQEALDHQLKADKLLRTTGDRIGAPVAFSQHFIFDL